MDNADFLLEMNIVLKKQRLILYIVVIISSFVLSN